MSEQSNERSGARYREIQYKAILSQLLDMVESTGHFLTEHPTPEEARRTGFSMLAIAQQTREQLEAMK
jgi:hypothetical protein